MPRTHDNAKSRRNARLILALSASGVIASVVTLASGATNSWLANVNDDFHDATRWSLGRVPNAGDYAFISIGSARPIVTYSAASGNREIQGIRLGDELRVTGGSLSITGGRSDNRMEPNSIYRQSGGVLNWRSTGSMGIDGQFDLTGGTLRTLNPGASTAAGPFQIRGLYTQTGGDLRNDGSGAIRFDNQFLPGGTQQRWLGGRWVGAGAGSFQIASGSLTIGANDANLNTLLTGVEVSSGASLVIDSRNSAGFLGTGLDLGGAAVVVSHGNLSVLCDGSGARPLDGALDGASTIENRAEGANAAAFVSTGGVTRFGENVTWENYGNVNVQTSGLIDFQGYWDNLNGGVAVGGGGQFQLGSDSFFAHTGYSGGSALTVGTNTSVVLARGDHSIESGNLAFGAGASLVIAEGASVSMYGPAVIAPGTIFVSDGTLTLEKDGAEVSNGFGAAAKTLHVGPLGYVEYGQNSQVRNDGTVRVQGGELYLAGFGDEFQQLVIEDDGIVSGDAGAFGLGLRESLGSHVSVPAGFGNRIDADITMQGRVPIDVASDAALIIAGEMKDFAGSPLQTFEKTGSGELYLEGLANTFTGPTLVHEGLLVLGKEPGDETNDFGSAVGDVSVGAGAVVSLEENEQIRDSATVTLDGGTFDVGEASEQVASVVMRNDATVTYGFGVGVLSTDQIRVESGSANWIDAALSTYAEALELQVAAGAAVTVAGPIDELVPFYKTGPGAASVTSDVGFLGATVASEGTLNLTAASFLDGGGGFAVSDLTVLPGAQVNITTDEVIDDNASVSVEGGQLYFDYAEETVAGLTISTQGVVTKDSMDFQSRLNVVGTLGQSLIIAEEGGGTIQVPLGVAGQAEFFVAEPGDSLTLHRLEDLTGLTRLVKTGPGSLTILENSDLSEGTQIEEGTVTVTGDDALGASGAPLRMVGGKLELAGPTFGFRPVQVLGNAEIDGDLFAAELGDVTGPGDLTLSGGDYFAMTRLDIRALSVNTVNRVLYLDDVNSIRLHRVEELTLLRDPQGTAEPIIDLTDDALAIDYFDVSPFAQVAADVRTGANDQGGFTSLFNDEFTGIGYAEASDVLGPFGGTFLGQPVDGDTVLLRYTLFGDADLDGEVDIGDFARLASNFNLPGFWSAGDFDYDGTVGISDFARLASNFNQSVSAAEAARGMMSRGSAVPEPGFASAALLLIALGQRTRRHPGSNNTTSSTQS